MQSLIRVALCGIVACMSASAIAETVADIIHEMDARKRASLAGINEYSQLKSTLGICTLEHFEKVRTESVDGRGAVEYMRLVPMSEVAARNGPDSPLTNATPEQLDRAAGALRQQAPAMDQAVRSELQGAGLPGNLGFLLTNPPSDKPWLSPMPSDMMGNYAMMLEGAAEGKRQDASRSARAEQEARKDPLAEIANLTRIAGRETMDGRPAIHLIADNLDQRQETNGQAFVLNTLHLWVDAEKYVPLKMQMDGTATDGRETRAMRIEREDSSYRAVPGCGSMYEPVQSVMRISGVMNPEGQAQMVQAQQKMVELEAQLASMPPAQKDMIMRQLGPQLEMFRGMAAGRGIELVSRTTGMRCNAGAPTNEEYMRTVSAVSQAASCADFGR